MFCRHGDSSSGIGTVFKIASFTSTVSEQICFFSSVIEG